VARGTARGEFRAIVPEHAARLCVAPILLIAIWRTTFAQFDAQPYDHEGLIEAHLQVLLQGWKRGRDEKTFRSYRTDVAGGLRRKKRPALAGVMAEGRHRLYLRAAAGLGHHMKIERGCDGASWRSSVRAGQRARAGWAQERRRTWPRPAPALTQEIANLAYAKTTLDRQNRLARDNAGTPPKHDLALSNYRQSEARIAQLRSQIAQMEANLTSASYGLVSADIVAQTDGRVQDIFFREGEYVARRHAGGGGAAAQECLCPLLVPEPEIAAHQDRRHGAHHLRRLQAIDAKVTFLAAREGIHPAGDLQPRQSREAGVQGEARLPQGLDLHPGQPVEVRPQ